jgi:hypothetical protein
MLASTTATHNDIEHIIAPIRLTVGSVAAGSFIIYAVSDWRLTGTFTVQWKT